MIAILGPTSSGKTSLALKIAEKFGFSIISCDSRQIYKYFDVGTGKIPINSNYSISKHDDFYKINGVKIYGYDIVDPDKQFSSYEFGEYAKKAAEIIKNDGKQPVLVGGTGFYADSVFLDFSLLPEVKPNITLRNKLNLLTVEQIRGMFPSSLINSLNESEKNNKQRLMRKLEILEYYGEIPKINIQNKNHKIIILNAANELLFKRVDEWADTIWDELISEAYSVIKNGFQESVPMKGLIYSTIFDLISGKISQDDARQRVKFDLHKYIRRQKTWFRKYDNSINVDISMNNTYNEVEKIVINELNAK